MKTYVFYRSNTEDEVAMRGFMHDLKLEREDKNVTLMDINTREGDEKARLYDIKTYPTVLTAANDGQLIRQWDGMLPLVRELTYYLRQK